MSTHTTKHRNGDGTWIEKTKTTYPSGASKTVVKDITDRTLLHDGSVVAVTRTDEKGNSRTERYK